MKLIVFGATGGTGQEVVKQALARGHEVTAFVRRAGVLGEHPRLREVLGDLFDLATVGRAIAGHDAVVTCLGSRTLGESHLLDDASANIVAAMDAQGVKRLVALGAAGAEHDAQAQQTSMRKAFFWVVRHTLLANPMKDSAAQERRIEASDLDYTVVHPPRLTDGPYTGHYRVDFQSLPAGGQSISRADVADFMLQALEEHRFVRQGPYVAV